MVEMLLPKNDLVFKMLFGDKRNIDILTDFLQSVLDLPIEEYDEVNITNPSFLQEFRDDKLSILDVSVKTKSGKMIDIEIQVRSQDHFKARILYYLAKMITEQMGKGRDYGKIRQAISIVITDFELNTESCHYHNKYHLRDDENNLLFSDLIEVNTLELPKLPKTDDGSKLWAWLNFLKVNNEKEFEMTTQTVENPLIKKAATIVKYMSYDETMRHFNMRKELAEMDKAVAIRAATEEGLAIGKLEGMQQGMQQQLLSIILRMKQANKSLEEISLVTGLSGKEITVLLQN